MYKLTNLVMVVLLHGIALYVVLHTLYSVETCARIQSRIFVSFCSVSIFRLYNMPKRSAVGSTTSATAVYRLWARSRPTKLGRQLKLSEAAQLPRTQVRIVHGGHEIIRYSVLYEIHLVNYV